MPATETTPRRGTGSADLRIAKLHTSSHIPRRGRPMRCGLATPLQETAAPPKVVRPRMRISSTPRLIDSITATSGVLGRLIEYTARGHGQHRSGTWVTHRRHGQA